MTIVNLFHAITDTFLCTFLEFLHVLANAINFQQESNIFQDVAFSPLLPK